MFIYLHHLIDTYRKGMLFISWLAITVVLVGSLVPGSMVAPVFFVSDKLIHLGAYALLLGLFAPFYHQKTSVRIGIRLVAFGVVIEFLQGGLGLRSFDGWDMVANAVGVISMWMVLHFLYFPRMDQLDSTA